MKNVIGVINLGKSQNLLDDLTRNRSIASVPFAGRYRLIDFALSNMVNSGISKVAVFTLNKSRSLTDHLGSGKDWDLDRKHGGLFILPPSINFLHEEYKGDLQNFHGHIDYFRRSSKEEYVIVSRSHMVCNINFQDALKHHIDAKADVTVLYKSKELKPEACNTCLQVEMDSKGRVLHMPTLQEAEETRLRNVYMETFIINKSLLVELIEDNVAQEKYDMTSGVILDNLSKMRVVGYEHHGHLAVVNSTASYYRESMRLLNPAVWKDLFYKPGLIYTKIKDEPPVKYMERADVRSSMIANGCIIQGTVENSILFRGVKVGPGAVIRNSIIMQDCEIGAGAHIENMILDKEVQIQNGKMMFENQDRPLVIDKRSVI